MQWDWAAVRQGIHQCREDHHVVELNDVEYQNVAGQKGFLNIVLTPTHSASNGKLEVILLATDITQRRSMEVELRQAQKLQVIGQLAAGIAHELNTPAQYVGDNVRFLKDAFDIYSRSIQTCKDLVDNGNSPTPELLEATSARLKADDVDYLSEQVPAALAETLEGIQRISKIVKAMKDFSHPGGHEKSPADLNKAIESTATVARHEWKYIADLDLDLDKSLPLVPCLVGEFNQVILNLIVNAAHAIGDANRESNQAKGKITLATRVDGHYAEVRVSDTGTGIPESAREKLFEPFFTTKEVGKGTGQGLFIARKVIVEKHGGSISYETKMGVGTTFIVRLPLSSLPLTSPVANKPTVETAPKQTSLANA